MNILFLTWNFPPTSGGIEYVMGNLFDTFRDKGHRVRVVTARAEVSDSRPDVHRVAKQSLLGYLWKSLFSALRLCKESKPDVVVCGTLVTAPAAWILAKRHGVPFLILIHGTDIVRGGAIYRCLAKWFVARATRLAANSENTKRLIEEAGISADRVDVIPPGVRADRFRDDVESPPLDEVADVAPHRKVLLTVGRLIRRKGVLEFVQHVMPELVRRCPDVVFLVVGDDPSRSLAHHDALKDRIAAEATKLNLDDHVHLLGEVADDRLLALFRRADLFVLPCLDIPGDVEGFGIVFLEAALTRTPAVSTRSGGIPEAVEDGTTGVLVDPGDFDGMTDAIAELLENDERRTQLGQAAADRSQGQFDWPIIADCYLASLQRCIDEKR